MIPRETIERVYSAARIDEVVSEYVSLRKRGSNLIGLCPFHNERTGSFTVSPSKGIYKCFGCGKAGNVIGFVMDIEQCDFVTAVKQVANKYHIEIKERELTPEEQQRQDDRESMFIVNEFANKWFQNNLWETEEGRTIGLSYFRERGLRDDIIKKFQLGYSPAKGSPLAKLLKEKGYQDKYVLNNENTKIGTGICGQTDDGKIYDRFRNRVIFPSFTVSGKTVAFSGRIMSDRKDVGKYVNSPESIIFVKGHELFGLNFAKQEITNKDLCYLVEGQMDVISMHQAGITNVVSSGGTSLTQEQIPIIKRFTNNITILYDGDSAGIHAALRGIDMCLEQGLNVNVVLLPEGDDPDSFAQSHDSSEVIAYIKEHQTDFISFKAQILSQDAKLEPQKLSVLIENLVQSIAAIPDHITRQVYIRDAAERMNIQESSLGRAVTILRNQKAEDRRKQQEQEKRRQETEAITNVIITEQKNNSSYPISEQQLATSPLAKNFINLLQVIIRYGERPLYDLGNGTYLTAGDYIISQLEADAIETPLPIYQSIINEYKIHSKEQGFIAETFFKFHPDPQISRLSTQLITEKYQLSRIYAKQSISENVVQEIELQSDGGRLQQLVPQLLLELKYTVINQRIDQLQDALKEAQTQSDWDKMKVLLETQPKLIEIQKQISQSLGNRVLTR